MSMFIEIANGVYTSDGNDFAKAMFHFGHDYESCFLPLSYWKLLDYKQQWKHGINHILDCNKNSILVTSILSPADATNIVAWVLYPIDENGVAIQQHMLFRNDVIANESMIHYESLPQHQTINEENEEISEWYVHRAVMNESLTYLS